MDIASGNVETLTSGTLLCGSRLKTTIMMSNIAGYGCFHSERREGVEMADSWRYSFPGIKTTRGFES